MNRTLRTPVACLTPPALAAAMLLGALALPAAAADFVTSDRTIANGNPMNGSYSGQAILVGASGIFDGEVTRVPNVRVDIVAPAQLNFSDATGGFLALYSNSVVRMTGGSAGTPSGFANVGRFTAYDTSQLEVSGGSLSGITLNGASAGAAGARATVSGGILQSSAGIVAYGTNGTLDVSGGLISATGGNVQPGIQGDSGSVITLSGGTVQSTSGAGVYIHMNSAFTMTGGTATGGPGGVAQWGVRLEGTSQTANLQGGTVNGGMRTSAGFNQTALQATLGGSLTVNGGVFAYSNAAVNVTGGSYTRFAGADASFFTMGSNNINFYGTDLALSDPTAGSVFELNNYIGNFYTFTGGTFSDGQSAIGLRLFDATSVAGNVLGGGFTLNPSAVPEPSTWLLMALALPAIGAAVRRRNRA
jgi:hypothetical protein